MSFCLHSLEDIVTGYKTLGSGLMILNSFLFSFFLFFSILCHLASMASDENFTVIWVVPLYKCIVFLWLLSRCFPLVFSFQQFNYELSMHEFLWLYPVWDLLSFLNCKFLSFGKFGGFSAIISSTFFSAWHIFSSPSETNDTNIRPFRYYP